MKKKLIYLFALLLIPVLVVNQLLAQATNKLDSTGNVGVGTTSPQGKQHIVLSASGVSPSYSTAPSLILEHSGFNGQLQFLTHSNYASFIFFGDERSYGRGSITYDHRSESEKLSFNVNEASRMSILANGNTGVGSTGPVSKFVVSNDGANGLEIDPVTGSNSGTNILSFNRSAVAYSQMLLGASNFVLTTGNVSNAMVLTQAGFLGVGTTSPTEKLSVDGSMYASGNISAYGFIKTKKLTVTQTAWPDYVFTKNYKLRSLSSLESFIKQNKHLPEVPSAKEVEEKGISVGDNQALLLKKIEELTLYVIGLKKESIEQQKRIRKLEKNK